MSVLCTQLGGYNDSKVPPEHLRLWAETSRIDLPMKRSLSRGGNGMPTSMSINESCRQVATTWVTDGHEDLSQIRISRLSKISSRGENNRLPGPGHGKFSKIIIPRDFVLVLNMMLIAINQ
jgi:hypothetical protein